MQQLKAHVNNNIRAGAFDEPTKFAQGFVQKYINFMQKKIDGYKTQAKQDEMSDKLVQGVKFIKEHVPGIVSVYDLYLKIIQSKIIIVKKLEQIRQMDTFVQTDNGYAVTSEEGFVAVDRIGNALKLVDRLEFSRLNFGSGIGLEHNMELTLVNEELCESRLFRTTNQFKKSHRQRRCRFIILNIISNIFVLQR